MSKKDQLELYFIALIPAEPIYSDVIRLKKVFGDEYNSSAALRSPPHITLHMPFKWKEEKEDLLYASLSTVAKNHSPIELSLENFGAFEPRVIYINVGESENLSLIQKDVLRSAVSDWHIYPMRGSRPFKPHMTIGFRDLKKPMFREAWKRFKNEDYQKIMLISNISLLKHNGRSWDIYKNFELAADNN